MIRQRPGAAPSGQPRFPDRQECGSAAPALTGRTAIIVTDERDMHVEKVVTARVLLDAGAGPMSRPVSYTEFFGSPPQADILLLRSSRIFAFRAEELAVSLEKFRRENPRSAVIVCVFEEKVTEALRPLLESGVINLIEDRPPGDRELLCRGAQIFQKLDF